MSASQAAATWARVAFGPAERKPSESRPAGSPRRRSCPWRGFPVLRRLWSGNHENFVRDAPGRFPRQGKTDRPGCGQQSANEHGSPAVTRQDQDSKRQGSQPGEMKARCRKSNCRVTECFSSAVQRSFYTVKGGQGGVLTCPAKNSTRVRPVTGARSAGGLRVDTRVQQLAWWIVSSACGAFRYGGTSAG